MSETNISRRGVYYDLNLSPYEFITPYGDVFKFRSEKKLEIYTRDIIKELERLEKVIDRNDMRRFLADEIQHLLRRTMYKSFYKKIEG